MLEGPQQNSMGETLPVGVLRNERRKSCENLPLCYFLELHCRLGWGQALWVRIFGGLGGQEPAVVRGSHW